ncbi:MAG: hypothetical protein ACI8XB_003007 [Patiriisocius sp.]|jgi:hypothetical protein
MRSLKIIVLLAFIAPLMVNAQCGRFTKKKCLPMLEEYLPNENFNNAVLMPGDEAEINMTFFAGQAYRLFVCNEPILGNVQYKVMDMNDKVVFDSETSELETFDFEVENTLKMKVQIIVPEGDVTHTLTPQGCVTVLLGHKDNSGSKESTP